MSLSCWRHNASYMNLLHQKLATPSMSVFRYAPLLVSQPKSDDLDGNKNVALYLICFVAPLVLMPIINFITVRSWWDLHNSLSQTLLFLLNQANHLALYRYSWMYANQLVYFFFGLISPLVILGLALTGALTQMVKITVGRPRPGSLTPYFLTISPKTIWYSRPFVQVSTTFRIV